MEEIKDCNDLLIRRYQKASLRYALLRAIFFVLFLLPFFIHLLPSHHEFFIQSIFLVSFFYVVYLSDRVKNKLSFCEAKGKIISNEDRRRKNDYEGFALGRSFKDDSHSFNNDLGLFGHFSLFQHINRAYDPLGKKGLADILLENEVSFVENKKRQELIKLMEDKEDWLLDLFAHSYQINKNGQNILIESSIPTTSSINFPKWLPIVQGILFVLASFTFFVDFGAAMLFLLINAIISYKCNRVAKKHLKNQSDLINKLTIQCAAYQNMARFAVSLHSKNELYLSLIKDLEEEDGFIHQAGYLKKWVDMLYYSNLPGFGSSSNLFYQILNQSFSLDFFFVSKVNRWFLTNEYVIDKWLNMIAQIVGFSSIGMYNVSKKNEYAYPEITDDPFTLKAKNMGHPLLPCAVKNDVYLSKKESVKIITGSNMSGKSTYLRSIGLALLLAKVGSRVCADSFSCYPHAIFTSFELKDNLSSGQSSFMAEIKRIKKLIDLIHEKKQPFFLLDEILRGTNSKDRITSCYELIQLLQNKECFGYITTHDLMLPEKLDGKLNDPFYYFSSTIIENELVFDYKIKKGICPETNGFFLMKKENII